MGNEHNLRIKTRGRFKQYNKGGDLDLGDWRKVFVELEDPTEYSAAIELLGSWELWEYFKKDWKEFRETILPIWHAELEVRLRSKAIKSVCDAYETDKTAAKWIAEGKYKVKQAGRPTKEQVTREAKIQAGVDEATSDEISRVMNHVKSVDKRVH